MEWLAGFDGGTGLNAVDDSLARRFAELGEPANEYFLSNPFLQFFDAVIVRPACGLRGAPSDVDDVVGESLGDSTGLDGAFV